MRTQEESAVKRDAETGRYYNENDDETSQQPIEQEEDSEREDFEDQRFEDQQSEEEEDIGAERVDVEDEEAESFDPDTTVRKSVEQGEEVEHELTESSSGSWESGDEDAELVGQRSVAVARETAADIPVSRLMVVPDTDRRQKHESTKMSLRGQQQLLSLTSSVQTKQINLVRLFTCRITGSWNCWSDCQSKAPKRLLLLYIL